MILTASSEGAQSRTSLVGEDEAHHWTNGDKIRVYGATDEVFTGTAMSDPKLATFEGDNPGGSYYTTDEKYQRVYCRNPYTYDNKNDNIGFRIVRNK